ncbi:hypothetical protein ALC60_00693 [Trachymyrmex zeteki]|uniref:Uncharacterized protein n=1 Tax=Mycetomoellerius zeteki TaxID=64791 RepID=A0A151XIZ5_9HYME|nr:hypothetical protein ALC60_00693 [Trachymyrmex zeteki]
MNIRRWQVVRCLVFFYIATRRKLLVLVITTPSFLPYIEGELHKAQKPQDVYGQQSSVCSFSFETFGCCLLLNSTRICGVYRTVALSIPDVTSNFTSAVKERRARKTDRQRERERQRETKRVRRETGERTERKQRNVEWKKKWKENGGSRAFSGIEFGAMDG